MSAVKPGFSTLNRPNNRHGNAQAAKKAANAILKLRDHGIIIDSSTTILDFGCAEGFLSQNLISSVKRVIGIETSSEKVNEFNMMVHNQGIDADEMHAICADLLTDCEDSLYSSIESDLVIASSVYHHIEDIPLLTSRLRRCVKPGGWLVIIDMLNMLNDQDSNHPHRDIDSKGCVVKHHGGFTIEKLSKVLTQAEFTQLGHDIAFEFYQTIGELKQSRQNLILWGMK